MNIFVLSLSGCPIESARMHCDQHLHKMILESAQMLSTALWEWGFSSPYKSAYEKHPCTIWTKSSPAHAYWLCMLASELEEIRQELDSPFHAASHVIKLTKDILEEEFPNAISVPPFSFAFAGPAHLQLKQSLSVPEKYQAYYKYKHKQWLDKGRGMSYKGRPIPSFMQEILS